MQDRRPWAKGCERELSAFDNAVSRASIRKRQAESWEDWRESVSEARRCKRQRSAWLRSTEVAWRDAKQLRPNRFRIKPTKVMLLGCLLLLRSCGIWRQSWRVAGSESDSPELLEGPRTSPEVP